jgi:hypothetical protein
VLDLLGGVEKGVVEEDGGDEYRLFLYQTQQDLGTLYTSPTSTVSRRPLP